MNICTLTITGPVHAAILDQVKSEGSADVVASFNTAKITPTSTVTLWCGSIGQEQVSLAWLAFDELEAAYYRRVAPEDVDDESALSFADDAADAVNTAVNAWAASNRMGVSGGECDEDGQLHYTLTAEVRTTELCDPCGELCTISVLDDAHPDRTLSRRASDSM